MIRNMVAVSPKGMGVIESIKNPVRILHRIAGYSRIFKAGNAINIPGMKRVMESVATESLISTIRKFNNPWQIRIIIVRENRVNFLSFGIIVGILRYDNRNFF
jgi:hypothetical protein